MRAGVRRRIQKEVKFAGLSIRPDAVHALESVLAREEDVADSLALIVSSLKTRVKAGRAISREAVAEVVAELTKDDDDLNEESLSVVDAFEVPTFKFNSTRNQFYSQGTSTEVDATDQTCVLRDRYIMLRQRLLRHPKFAPPILGSDVGSSSRGIAGDGRHRVLPRKMAGSPTHIEITQIESLAADHGQKCLLGLLSRLGDGELYLEDLNGSVRLDISEAEFGPGLITEGCIVLVEGEMDMDCFKTARIGFPPAENRQQTLLAHGGVNFVTGEQPKAANVVHSMKQLEKEAVSMTFAFLSDVHLDNPFVLKSLRVMLAAFEVMQPPPAMMVLMGNFSNSPFGCGEGQCSAKTYTSLLGDLANLLCDHPRLLQSCTFVLVPGPCDPGNGQLLPRPRIPRYFRRDFDKIMLERAPEQAKTVQFQSNPCRVQFFTQEIVVFREDLLSKMRRNCLNEPDETTLSVCDHLVRTIVQQGHLSPLPGAARPIYWARDASLRMYPLPHLVIMGDRFDQFEYEFSGCKAMNTGSFSLDASFVLYRPAAMQGEFSKVTAGLDDDDDDDDDDDEGDEDESGSSSNEDGDQ